MSAHLLFEFVRAARGALRVFLDARVPAAARAVGPSAVAGIAAALALAGCATPPAAPVPAGMPSLFSSARNGGGLPDGWAPFIIRPDKRRTDYELVSMNVPGSDGVPRALTVVHASASSAASGLEHPVAVDLARTPVLAWQWRADRLIDAADNLLREADDSPNRIVLAFDGDRSQLSMRDRILSEQARLFTGRDLPYATLIYIRENHAPVGTVIPNRVTDRIRMLVVESGADGLGRWQLHRRDVRADFIAAFGEEPGALRSVGLLTDSDNTRSDIDGWYGDLHFAAR